MRGKVHHRLDRVLAENPCDIIRIPYVTGDEFTPGNQVAVTSVQVVQCYDRVACAQQV